MGGTSTDTITNRLCTLDDLRMVERGWLLSKVDKTGAALAGAAGVGLGEFQKDDSVMGEAYECDNCGREFEDDFSAALKHTTEK